MDYLILVSEKHDMIADPPSQTAPICPLTGERMKFWQHVPCDWRRPNVGSEYNLFWSDKGRFGQLFPRPSPSEVASFYETEYYTHSDRSEESRPRHMGFFARLREHLAWRLDFGTDITPESLAKLVPGNAHPAVLEIGCGDGGLLAKLRTAGWNCTGIEPDPVARKVAAERGLEVYEGTAEDPPAAIRAGQFDLVVMQHVLEHCLDPLLALRIATSYLKPGGVMVIETPNNAAKGCYASGATWPWLDVPRHLNFFTAHSLDQMCQQTGTTRIATEYTGYIRQFQNPWIENEQYICKIFNERGKKQYYPPSSLSHWNLLLTTGFARARFKYDSVRIISRRDS